MSTRTLAEAVARAGRRVLAVDLFGDDDTRAAAAGVAVVPGSLDDGPDLDATLAAVEQLAAAHGEPAGVVVGSGFEHRPAALAVLAARWPLLGCPPQSVAAVKDPERLAQLCGDLSIPHPEIAFDRPADPSGWLTKQAAGSGGSHVAPAASSFATGDTSVAAAPGRYFQRRVDGLAMSAALLCGADGTRLLGFCAATFAPSPAAPYRFGGLTGPVTIGATMADEIAAAAGSLAVAVGLTGLVGLDLIIGDTGWWLIEVNPRPTAALDVLDRGAPALMALHLAVCAGAAAPAWAPPSAVAATAIVYAARGGVTVAADWPDWTSDRPPAATEVAAGAPLCTVRAEGCDLPACTAILEDRARRAATLAFGAAVKH